MTLRPLADTGLHVSPVALGCWPIAGVTTLGATPEHSRATVAAALDAGINHLDTAHAYGYRGESERIVGEVVRPMIAAEGRDRVVVASKCGLVWGERRGTGGSGKRPQFKDGRPETIRAQCDESLTRLGLDVIDLYYLHAPDPKVPVAESAGAIAELIAAGKVRAAGVSNFTSEAQYRDFASACPFAADQQPYNMLQTDIETDRVPWARRHGRPGVAIATYWPLMKGLLAGKLSRAHVFADGDSRAGYPVFQEPEWSKTQDLLDRLREIAADLRATVAQLVVAWTLARPAVTTVLCGAKRPTQIIETAAAMRLDLPPEATAAIDSALRDRGSIAA